MICAFLLCHNLRNEQDCRYFFTKPYETFFATKLRNNCYIANRVPLNFEHLQKRIREFNDEDITKERFMEMLHEKLSTTNMEAVKQDVRGFIFNQRDIEIWSNDYFLKLADMMVFKD